MKPLILITAEEVFDDTTHRHYFMTKRSYSTALSGAGAASLMAVEPRCYREYAEIADGLLLTDGRADINPARYGVPVTERYSGMSWYGHGFEYGRDSFELSLCKAFLAAGKPVMGIGRGMYILNTALGGKLHQDICEDLHLYHPIGAHHSIRTAEDTPLRGLIGETARVNSFHHQAISSVGDGLKIAASSEDGLIEAVWHAELPAFGVQWNPEAEHTGDEMTRERHLSQTGSCLVNEKAAAQYWENQLTMTPDSGYPTDWDTKASADHPLFDYFISLCGKEE